MRWVKKFEEASNGSNAIRHECFRDENFFRGCVICNLDLERGDEKFCFFGAEKGDHVLQLDNEQPNQERVNRGSTENSDCKAFHQKRADQSNYFQS